MRNFETWFSQFRESIADYKFYIDYDTVYRNIEPVKEELEALNILIGSKEIELDFFKLIKNRKEILKVIPILIAKREYQIFAMDNEGSIQYDFLNPNVTLEQYAYFMKKTGLFSLLEQKKITNVLDYVVGIETGLNSNARKNRGGKLMESLVEKFIIDAGFIKGMTYEKEFTLSKIETIIDEDLSSLSNDNATVKRFDFVLFHKGIVYAIETNFYSSSGSKLNETARSYEMIARKTNHLKKFKFVWITDGKGWIDARNNLKQTFDVLEHIYSISDLENDILKTITK
jgi:type II restriction enzyme